MIGSDYDEDDENNGFRGSRLAMRPSIQNNLLF